MADMLKVEDNLYKMRALADLITNAGANGGCSEETLCMVGVMLFDMTEAVLEAAGFNGKPAEGAPA